MSRVRKNAKDNSHIWWLLAVIIGIFIIIFLAASGRLVPAASSTSVITALAPFQKALSWVGNGINDFTASSWEFVTVYKQNEMLKNEVVQLRQQNLKAEEYSAENLRLKELLNYKVNEKRFELMAAQVIGRDMDMWTEVIVIDRGSIDGISVNMPVVTERGLVGRIVSVGMNSSQVQLILDPRSSVSALVHRPESRVSGIIKGNMEDRYSPHMVNIPRNSDILEGDTIITSGFGGIYPKGLMIGYVTELKNDAVGLLDIATVISAVDFNKLEDVMVITSVNYEPLTTLIPPVQTAGTETNPDGTPIEQPQQ